MTDLHQGRPGRARRWRFAAPVIALLIPLAVVGQTVEENAARIAENAENIRLISNAFAELQNGVGSLASSISDINQRLGMSGTGTATPADAEVLEALRYLRAQFEALGNVADTPGTWTLYWLQAGGCEPVDVYFPNRDAPADTRTHISLPAARLKAVDGAVLLCQIDLYPNGPWSAWSDTAIRVWATHESGIVLWWPVAVEE